MATSTTGLGTDPRLARAVVKALDGAADALPELLTLRDGPMIALQGQIEAALRGALGIQTAKGERRHGGQ